MNMKKFIYLGIFLVFPSFAVAAKQVTNYEEEIFKEIDSTSEQVKNLSSPLQVIEPIFTPYTVVAIVANTSAPSCFLVDKDDAKKSMLIFAASENPVSYCSYVGEPIITKVGADYFATYEYGVGDQGEFASVFYKVIKIENDIFYACLEDGKLSDEIDGMVGAKMPRATAVREAIGNIGCTQDLNTFPNDW